jgi:hypothetical protein
MFYFAPIDPDRAAPPYSQPAAKPVEPVRATDTEPPRQGGHAAFNLGDARLHLFAPDNKDEPVDASDRQLFAIE